MTAPCVFSAELVRDIISYTSIRDVVRWRAVSKWFLAITHDPKVWRVLCASARFPRPQGPFPTVAFEQALVQSARLAHSWTTQPLRTLSRTSIPFEGWAIDDLHLIRGRWFVVCQLDRRFVMYDTNVNAEMREPQVIWEQKEGIVGWDECPGGFEDGKCIFYILFSTEDPPRLTLLEFQLDAESGAVCDTATFDIPVSEVDRDPALDGGQQLFARSPFLSIPRRSLVFDTRTRVFYEFPEFRIARGGTRLLVGSTRKGLTHIVPTNTHVIVLHDFYDKMTLVMNPFVVVQAFVVPNVQRSSGRGVLHLSHEGVYSSRKLAFAMIRNSVVDPITGTISVKLLERHWKYDGFPSTCISLTLSGPSPKDVSPITINQDPIVIRGDVPPYDDLAFCNEYYDITDDGHARGFFTRCGDCYGDASSGVRKFTIDATKNPCVAVVSGLSCTEWDDVIGPIHSRSQHSVLLDGVRGRLCYVDGSLDPIREININGALTLVDIE